MTLSSSLAVEWVLLSLVGLSIGLRALLQLTSLTVSDPQTEQRMCFEVYFLKEITWCHFLLLLEENHLAFLEGKRI